MPLFDFLDSPEVERKKAESSLQCLASKYSRQIPSVSSFGNKENILIEKTSEYEASPGSVMQVIKADLKIIEKEKRRLRNCYIGSLKDGNENIDKSLDQCKENIIKAKQLFETNKKFVQGAEILEKYDSLASRLGHIYNPYMMYDKDILNWYLTYVSWDMAADIFFIRSLSDQDKEAYPTLYTSLKQKQSDIQALWMALEAFRLTAGVLSEMQQEKTEQSSRNNNKRKF